MLEVFLKKIVLITGAAKGIGAAAAAPANATALCILSKAELRFKSKFDEY